MIKIRNLVFCFCLFFQFTVLAAEQDSLSKNIAVIYKIQPISLVFSEFRLEREKIQTPNKSYIIGLSLFFPSALIYNSRNMWGGKVAFGYRRYFSNQFFITFSGFYKYLNTKDKIHDSGCTTDDPIYVMCTGTSNFYIDKYDEKKHIFDFSVSYGKRNQISKRFIFEKYILFGGRIKYISQEIFAESLYSGVSASDINPHKNITFIKAWPSISLGIKIAFATY